jgi:hypothetical protein
LLMLAQGCTYESLVSELCFLHRREHQVHLARMKSEPR